MYHKIYIILAGFFSFMACTAENSSQSKEILTGADRIDEWFFMVEGKSIALVANQTSEINGIHLADTLLSLGADLKKVFSPEHGFRGNADAGAPVKDGKDVSTGLPVISLYGAHKKPFPEDIEDVDIIIFDIQDVGARFYTYISTLHYVMEACAENDKKILVLDRPNPNGNYVDGPVLEPKHKSFVGMHTVPVVHGMTIGEYALMVNNEEWLKDSIKCDLEVISCLNYDHRSKYVLPVRPSPNLPVHQSVLLYPSLAFFEGTGISVGRGTDFPFMVFGHPELTSGGFYFTPESRPGASMNPPWKGQKCRGVDLREYEPPKGEFEELNLEWLIWAYNNMPEKVSFFNNYFTKLAGTEKLQEQIENGRSEEEIRASWGKDIHSFKEIRKKYLLYEDFE